MPRVLAAVHATVHVVAVVLGVIAPKLAAHSPVVIEPVIAPSCTKLQPGADIVTALGARPLGHIVCTTAASPAASGVTVVAMAAIER